MHKQAWWPLAAAMAIHAAVLAILSGVPATQPSLSTEPPTIELMLQREPSPEPPRREATPSDGLAAPSDMPALHPQASPVVAAEPTRLSDVVVAPVEAPSPLGAISPPPPIAPAEPDPVLRSSAPDAPRADPRPDRASPSPQVRPTPPVRKKAKPADPATPQPTMSDAPTPSVSASAAPPASGQIVSVDSSAAWRGALAAWLRDHRTYPDAARSDGIEGRVVVRFTVDRTGAVRDATLAQSSGSPLLDEAAIAMFRGARLPPPPGASVGLVALTLPIRYSLRP